KPLFLLNGQLFNSLSGGCVEIWRRRFLDGFDQLSENSAALALNAQIGREAPYRRRALEHVDIDLRPEGIGVVARRNWNPRYVDIDQEANINVGQIIGLKTAEVRKRAAYVCECQKVYNANARGSRQTLDCCRSSHIAPRVGGDQDGILCRKQTRGELINQLGVSPTRLELPEPFAGKRTHGLLIPCLR